MAAFRFESIGSLTAIEVKRIVWHEIYVNDFMQYNKFLFFHMGGDNKIQYQSRAYPAVEVPDNNQFDALFSSLYTDQNQQVLCDPKKHNTVLT